MKAEGELDFRTQQIRGNWYFSKSRGEWKEGERGIFEIFMGGGGELLEMKLKTKQNFRMKFVPPLSIFWPVYFSCWSYELEVLWLFIKFYMEHGTNKIFLVCWVTCQNWLVCQWLSTPEVYHGYVDSLLHCFSFRICMQFFLYFCKVGSYCVHY